MVEIGLVDRRAGKAVFDVNVDVVFAEREAGLFALVLDQQRPAGEIALGHEPGFGRGHQVFGPIQRVRSAGSRGYADVVGPLAATQDDLLAGVNFFAQPVDFDFTLRHQDAIFALVDVDGEAGAKGGNPPVGCLDDERRRIVSRGFFAGRDVHENSPLAERHPPLVIEPQLRLGVDVQHRPVGQHDAASLAALGLNLLANLHSLGLRARRTIGRRNEWLAAQIRQIAIPIDRDRPTGVGERHRRLRIAGRKRAADHEDAQDDRPGYRPTGQHGAIGKLLAIPQRLARSWHRRPAGVFHRRDACATILIFHRRDACATADFRRGGLHRRANPLGKRRLGRLRRVDPAEQTLDILLGDILFVAIHDR